MYKATESVWEEERMMDEKLTEEERDKIYHAEHKKRVLEGLKRSNTLGGRSRKEINRETVIKRLNQGIPMTEIAAGQHMSVQSLKRRMREAGIKMKYEQKEEKG